MREKLITQKLRKLRNYSVNYKTNDKFVFRNHCCNEIDRRCALILENNCLKVCRENIHHGWVTIISYLFKHMRRKTRTVC